MEAQRREDGWVWALDTRRWVAGGMGSDGGHSKVPLAVMLMRRDCWAMGEAWLQGTRPQSMVAGPGVEGIGNDGILGIFWKSG